MNPQSPIQLKRYQTDMIELAKRKNIIVNLPTGSGKTLIAVELSRFYLNKSPQEKILWIFPTRALIQQQARVIQEHIPEADVVEIEDSSNPDYSKGVILVGVAEVCRRAFVDYGVMKMNQFSLFVVDECHNAVGNHPMAALFRDVITPSNFQGRILGLTASFVNGSLSSIQTSKSNLQKTMMSEIVTSEVNDRNQDMKRVTYSKNNHFQLDLSKVNLLPLHDKLIIQILGHINIKNVHQKIFDSLGLYGCIIFVKKQKENLIDLIVEAEYKTSFLTVDEFLEKKQEAIKLIQNYETDLEITVGMEPNPTKLPYISGKVAKALEIIMEMNGQGDSKGVLFIEERKYSYPLCVIIDKHFNTNFCQSINADTSKTRINEIMQQFQKGDIKLIVSTTALEEGIDVPKCNYVILFDRIHTAKSFIQSTGRARSTDSYIYCFENDPTDEYQKVNLVNFVANNDSGCVTPEDMNAHIHESMMNAKSHFWYPHRHPTTGAIVNLSNCKKIFNEYCQCVLRDAYPLTRFYKYKSTNKKELLQIDYPSPIGVLTMKHEELRRKWDSDQKLKELIQKERGPKQKLHDFDLSKFVFAVVVDLIERGYITEENVASAEAKYYSKAKCPELGPPEVKKTKLKNSFNFEDSPSGKKSLDEVSNQLSSLLAGLIINNNNDMNFENNLRSSANINSNYRNSNPRNIGNISNVNINNNFLNNNNNNNNHLNFMINNNQNLKNMHNVNPVSPTGPFISSSPLQFHNYKFPELPKEPPISPPKLPIGCPPLNHYYPKDRYEDTTEESDYEDDDDHYNIQNPSGLRKLSSSSSLDLELFVNKTITETNDPYISPNRSPTHSNSRNIINSSNINHINNMNMNNMNMNNMSMNINSNNNFNNLRNLNNLNYNNVAYDFNDIGNRPISELDKLLLNDYFNNFIKNTLSNLDINNLNNFNFNNPNLPNNVSTQQVAPVKNYKGLLQERMQKAYKGKSTIKYDTKVADNSLLHRPMFISKVEVTAGNTTQEFQGSTCTKKMDAEQSAAQVAYERVIIK